MEILLPFKVRTYDIDFAGIVSNLVYIRWLEDLRLELLARSYPLEHMISNGFGPALLETQISYRNALTIHDAPEGHMTVESLGRVRWTVEAKFASQSGTRLHATARQVGIFMRLADRKPMAIPAEIRATLAGL